MTRLRDLTDALEGVVNDTLGDEITYTPAGGSAKTFNAWVTFDNEHISAGGSSATARGVLEVEVPKATIPAPTNDDRITVTIRPGVTYKPRDIMEGEGGQSWRIPLTKTRDV